MININQETASLIVEILAAYVIALAVLAFLTAVVVELIKDLKPFVYAPTTVIAMASAFVYTFLTMAVILAILKIPATWYIIACGIPTAFFVWGIADRGWEWVMALVARFKPPTNRNMF